MDKAIKELEEVGYRRVRKYNGGFVVKGVIERIKKLYNLRTDTEVAKILGFSRSLLYNYRISNAIPFKSLLKFCKKKHIVFTELYKRTESENKK